jgi:osmoprotectant transport system substrate-binding protein
MKFKHAFALGTTAAVLLLTAACGGGDSLEESDSGSTDSGSTDKGSLVLGGQDFTEMQIMASMYEQVLSNAGYDVTTKLVTTRDVYAGQLSKGKVDVVPDYLAGMTDYLNMLEPSQATDQNAFIVTQDFADENNLTTLSDMAALGDPIKLAAPADCEGRSDCEAGLTNVYGFTIEDIVPLDFGSAQLKDAVTNGEVDLGETGTTDGSLDQQGLVILEDDKGIQPAQNLIPAVNSDFLKDNPDIEGPLNELSQTLTTEDLATMNAQVDLERQKPEDVAQQFLTDNGLL